ncbi:MAG: hypothetical protein HQL27_03040, partial [Candidatus Omnitrophica bacterium]|nr:hypothetical protein [Candidatus Omnitrophota bacterium]
GQPSSRDDRSNRGNFNSRSGDDLSGSTQVSILPVVIIFALWFLERWLIEGAHLTQILKGAGSILAPPVDEILNYLSSLLFPAAGLSFSFSQNLFADMSFILSFLFGSSFYLASVIALSPGQEKDVIRKLSEQEPDWDEIDHEHALRWFGIPTGLWDTLTLDDRAVLPFLLRGALLDGRAFLDQFDKDRGVLNHRITNSMMRFWKWARRGGRRINQDYRVINTSARGVHKGKAIYPPFAIAYQKYLEPIAREFEGAAAAVSDAEMKELFYAQAYACRHDAWKRRDRIWMQILHTAASENRDPFGGSRLLYYFGPTEPKAPGKRGAFEMAIGIIDPQATKTLQETARIINPGCFYAYGMQTFLLSGCTYNTAAVQGKNLPNYGDVVKKWGSIQIVDLRIQRRILLQSRLQWRVNLITGYPTYGRSNARALRTIAHEAGHGCHQFSDGEIKDKQEILADYLADFYESDAFCAYLFELEEIRRAWSKEERRENIIASFTYGQVLFLDYILKNHPHYLPRGLNERSLGYIRIPTVLVNYLNAKGLVSTDNSRIKPRFETDEELEAVESAIAEFAREVRRIYLENDAQAARKLLGDPSVYDIYIPSCGRLFAEDEIFRTQHENVREAIVSLRKLAEDYRGKGKSAQAQEREALAVFAEKVLEAAGDPSSGPAAAERKNGFGLVEFIFVVAGLGTLLAGILGAAPLLYSVFNAGAAHLREILTGAAHMLTLGGTSAAHDSAIRIFSANMIGVAGTLDFLRWLKKLLAGRAAANSGANVSETQTVHDKAAILAFMRLFMNRPRGDSMNPVYANGRVINPLCDDKVRANSSNILAIGGCLDCAPIICRQGKTADSLLHAHHFFRRLPVARVSNEEMFDQTFDEAGCYECIFVIIADRGYLFAYNPLVDHILAQHRGSRVLLIIAKPGMLKTALVMKEGIGVDVGEKNTDKFVCLFPATGTSRTAALTWKEIYSLLRMERKVVVDFEEFIPVSLGDSTPPGLEKRKNGFGLVEFISVVAGLGVLLVGILEEAPLLYSVYDGGAALLRDILSGAGSILAPPVADFLKNLSSLLFPAAGLSGLAFAAVGKPVNNKENKPLTAPDAALGGSGQGLRVNQSVRRKTKGNGRGLAGWLRALTQFILIPFAALTVLIAGEASASKFSLDAEKNLIWQVENKDTAGHVLMRIKDAYKDAESFQAIENGTYQNSGLYGFIWNTPGKKFAKALRPLNNRPLLPPGETLLQSIKRPLRIGEKIAIDLEMPVPVLSRLGVDVPETAAEEQEIVQPDYLRKPLVNLPVVSAPGSVPSLAAAQPQAEYPAKGNPGNKSIRYAIFTALGLFLLVSSAAMAFGRTFIKALKRIPFDFNKVRKSWKHKRNVSKPVISEQQTENMFTPTAVTEEMVLPLSPPTDQLKGQSKGTGSIEEKASSAIQVPEKPAVGRDDISRTAIGDTNAADAVVVASDAMDESSQSVVAEPAVPQSLGSSHPAGSVTESVVSPKAEEDPVSLQERDALLRIREIILAKNASAENPLVICCIDLDGMHASIIMWLVIRHFIIKNKLDNIIEVRVLGLEACELPGLWEEKYHPWPTWGRALISQVIVENMEIRLRREIEKFRIRRVRDQNDLRADIIIAGEASPRQEAEIMGYIVGPKMNVDPRKVFLMREFYLPDDQKRFREEHLLLGLTRKGFESSFLIVLKESLQSLQTGRERQGRSPGLGAIVPLIFISLAALTLGAGCAHDPSVPHQVAVTGVDILGKIVALWNELTQAISIICGSILSGAGSILSPPVDEFLNNLSSLLFPAGLSNLAFAAPGADSGDFAAAGLMPFFNYAFVPLFLVGRSAFPRKLLRRTPIERLVNRVELPLLKYFSR